MADVNQSTETPAEVRAQCDDFRNTFAQLRQEIGKVMVGQQAVVDSVLVCLFAGGNVLLEGVPGLGKTLLVRTLATTLHLPFSRIQFTPDLMPADVIGTNIVTEDPDTGRRGFEFQRGPIFAQVVLADEINRATPKTQSALLEAMQERSVTSGGTTYQLQAPFLVLATQNPIEQEGTYPLPEAQMDRFLLKLRIGYPGRDDERQILDRMAGREVPAVDKVLDPAVLRSVRAAVGGVFVDEKIKSYILDLVFASRDPEAAGLDIAPLIAWGASPRATLALTQLARARALLRGRAFVVPEDVKAIGHDALRHRILVTYEAEAENMTSDDVVSILLDNIEVP